MHRTVKGCHRSSDVPSLVRSEQGSTSTTLKSPRRATVPHQQPPRRRVPLGRRLTKDYAGGELLGTSTQLPTAETNEYDPSHIAYSARGTFLCRPERQSSPSADEQHRPARLMWIAGAVAYHVARHRNAKPVYCHARGLELDHTPVAPLAV